MRKTYFALAAKLDQTPVEGIDPLGPEARLVTVDQGGHGVYLFNSNACGTNVVTRYLVEGMRPRFDQHCVKDGGLFGSLSAKDKAKRQAALREVLPSFIR